MNKLMKVSNLIKKCVLLGLGLFISVLALVLMIKSFEVYDDGWGTDISFNMDMVVLLMIGIAILVYACTTFKSVNPNNYYLTSVVVTTLTAFYPLGVFFKAMAKAKAFADYSTYLYVGIIGTILLVYFIFAYLDYKKDN